MDHVAGPLHILLAEKEGRNWFILIRLKLYQSGIITRWCLSIMKSTLKCVLESPLQCVMKPIMLEVILKIMVSRKTQISEDHVTLFIVRHVGLHVEFSSMKSSLSL
jgi:hypothetical protein